MMTRKVFWVRYDAGPDADVDKWALHREYYAQFVNEQVRALVLRSFGRSALIECYKRDRAFNTPNMPLRQWDVLVSALPYGIVEQLKEAGDWLSQGTGVCILKEAARQVAEQEDEHGSTRAL